MSRRKRKEFQYADIHTYVERVEDVLLSESSWSTSDSECSGCPHLSKGSTQSESEGEEKQTLDLPILPNQNSTFSNYSRDIRPSNRDTPPVTPVERRAFRSLTHQISKSASLLGALSASGVKCSSIEGSNGAAFTGSGMLQQLSLLAAGAQPWNNSVCTVHKNKFAYAATLVIYVYQVETGQSEWQLSSILADHRKTITCIHWHPDKEDLLASSSMDQCICVWSVSRQCVIQAISICKVPMHVAWCSGLGDILSFCTCSGPIQVWNISNHTEPIPYREDHPYSSQIGAYAWHPTVTGRLAVVHVDGKLTLYREDTTKIRYSVLVEGLDDGENHPTKIQALAWDYHSPDYLLMAYQEGPLWLVDVTSLKIVSKFILPMAATIATIAWLPDAPGMFVSGDRERGVLRIWSAGKSRPLENCILKDTGFHALCVPSSAPSAGSEGATRAIESPPKDEKGYNLPKVSVLSLFKDGGIGIYHIKRKEWMFRRDHGHTETIFDCSFKPEDSDLLATGSFDGSIKIWRVDSMKSIETLPNRNAIIYSLSWAPADLNCICAGTSTGVVFIWDLGVRQRVIQEFRMHKDKKVFCVAWNSKDSTRIASVGESCMCYVHQVSGPSGIMIRDWKHPAPVYGCDWRDEDVLATGCDDGKIRIFSVKKQSKDPIIEIKAHQKKVFRVKWNPVYSDILCSGSDDNSIKIWSSSRAQCLGALVGHTDNVRGLAWCPEIPNVLLSGSWDKTIRLWDAKSCECLDIVFDHRADVYGLSIHPLRPFLLASCSRDSTVRLWSLTSLVFPLQLKVLSGRPTQEVIRKKDVSGSFESDHLLCGLRSDHLLSVTSSSSADIGTVATGSSGSSTVSTTHSMRKVKLLADLFCADVHIRNLWDLVHVVQGNVDISSLSQQYPSSVVHHSHLLKCAMASASEKEVNMAKPRGIANRRTSSQLSGTSSNLRCSDTEDTSDALANLYLSYGALQQYCELMIKTSKWDHALALAPAISIDYWRQTVQRRGQELQREDDECCIPYLMASSNKEKLIEFHMNRGHPDLALTSCMGLTKSNRSATKALPTIPPRPPVKDDSPVSLVNETLLECTKKVADSLLEKGNPIGAACSMLAVDNIEGALLALVRGNEFDLVLVVGQLLASKIETSPNASTILGLMRTANQYLVYRAIRLGLFDVAIDLACMQEYDDSVLKAEVILSCGLGQREKEIYLKKCGFASSAQCAKIIPDTLFEAVLYALLSAQPLKGLDKAMDVIRECVVSSSLNCRLLWDVIRLAQAAVAGAPAGMISTEKKVWFLPVSAFLGGVRAAQQGFTSIVGPLLEHASNLMDKYNPSELEFLRHEIRKAREKLDSGCLNLGFELSEMTEVWFDVGLTKVAGSHLPRHADSHVSCITHQIIKGPSFFLEDDVSAIGQNDALMWAKVNLFSPLGTGVRMNPF